MYYVPVYFQAAKSASALRSGVEFLLLAVPQVVVTVMPGSALAPKKKKKTGYRAPVMYSADGH